MTLVEQIKQDLISAMKEKDKDKLNTLRSVKAGVQMEVINNKKEENDDLVLDVVNKQIKIILINIPNIFRNIFFTTLQFSVTVSFCINEKLCGSAGAELSHY